MLKTSSMIMFRRPTLQEEMLYSDRRAGDACKPAGAVLSARVVVVVSAGFSISTGREG